MSLKTPLTWYSYWWGGLKAKPLPWLYNTQGLTPMSPKTKFLSSRTRICQLPLFKLTFSRPCQVLINLRSLNWSKLFQIGIYEETKEKVDELERQLKKKNELILGSINFSDLSIHQGLEFPVKFKCLDFEKYNWKSCLYANSRFMMCLWHSTKRKSHCWSRLFSKV